MYALNKAGLSEMEVILAATKNGAEMLKVDHITGTLEKGKFADLLVLEDNPPLEDIHNISVDKMKVIMKEGQFVKKRIIISYYSGHIIILITFVILSTRKDL